MTELPDPPVPTDCDLRDFPFMPLDIARLRRSKAWLKAKRNPALAFYMVNLWTASWHDVPAGSLEDDDDVLADLAMCDPIKWQKLRADVLHGWVKCSDGRLYNPTVCEKVRESWASKLERRERDAHDRDRKRREREERGVMFDALRNVGIVPVWNIATRDLRALHHEHVTTSHDLSQGQVSDSHGKKPDESRLGQGEGHGNGEREGQGENKNQNHSSPPPPAAPDADQEIVEKIFGYWQKTMQTPRSKLDAARTKAIKRGLTKLKFDPADLCRAIRGCSLTPFNMGDNQDKKKHNDLDLIFRDAKHIEGFIEKAKNPPAPATTGGRRGEPTQADRDAEREKAKALLFGPAAHSGEVEHG